MSHGPSTFGTMTTSRRSPISETIDVMSSRNHGDSSALTRVHSWVSPSSMSRPTLMSPSRAGILRSTGTASSRLPRRMSTAGAMSGTFATIFSLEKSRKWIIREGRTGISRTGSGASMASGLKKSRGLRIRSLRLGAQGPRHVREHRVELQFDVLPGEAQRDPAGEDGGAVSPPVAAHGGLRAVRVEAVELDEDAVLWPHEVGLQGQGIEGEGLVDQRLGEAGPPEAAEQHAFEDASRRLGLGAVGGGQRPGALRSGATVGHSLDDLRPDQPAPPGALEGRFEGGGGGDVDEQP